MKKIFWFFMILIFSIQLTLAEHAKWNKIDIEKHSFYVDSTINKVSRDTIKKHLNIISSILDSCKHKNTNTGKTIKSSSKDSIKIIRNRSRKFFKYQNKSKKPSFNSAIVDSSGFLRGIYFPHESGSGWTREELQTYLRTKKIPESYKKIDEKKAIAIAREFHRAVYGKKEDSKFDSVYVVTDQSKYFVRLKIKPRNNIMDTRRSVIAVNANTGQIVSFNCEGLSDIDFNYVPKITKEQVLKMYKNAIDSLQAKIRIRKMGLNKYIGKNGERVWAWKIYGQREDKILYTSAMMFIDSETGDILFQKMD